MKIFLTILILSISYSCEDSSNEPATRRIYIDDHLADCTGVGPQKCMLVKENLEDEFTYFYDNIGGFNYEEGYNYILKVSIVTIKNPPADGSSKKYSLVEILKKEKT